MIGQFERTMALNPNVSTIFDVQPTDQELNDASSEVILQSSETIISKSNMMKLILICFSGHSDLEVKLRNSGSRQSGSRTKLLEL